MRFLRTGLVLVMGFALGTSVGCGPSRGAPRDAAEIARQEASRRLAGDWLLVSYQPETPLEPMFAGLLAAQMGTLVARFDGQQMTATGTGVATTRRYRVTQANGDRVAVVTYDESGIAYDAVGEFKGNELWFASLTIPWRGRGVLRRVR
ncbi:MAG: hypothetical protein HYZ29_03635 [Myxococcales bacterium]|nr:hypothetical protein [Myxococcales bacterium]